MIGSVALGLFVLTVAFGVIGRVDAALVVGGITFLLASFAIGLFKPMLKLAVIAGSMILVGMTLGWIRL